METWRDYLRFCLIRAHASFLDDAAFTDFFAVQSLFVRSDRATPYWRRVIWMEKYWLGQALGQLYTDGEFPRPVQVRYRALAEAFREAFRDRINKLEWMSDATKERALLKLSRMTFTLGLEQRADLSTMPLRRDPTC